MSRLDVIPEPRHRHLYPGEMSIEFTMGRIPEQGIPWFPMNIMINILYQNRQEQALNELAQTANGLSELPQSTLGDDLIYREHEGRFYLEDEIIERPFAEIERDVFTVAHDEGKPYFVYFDGPDDLPETPLDSTHIAMCIETLEGLVGARVAYELGYHMISMLDNRSSGAPIQPLYLRFRRIEDFNELYLNLGELVAGENGEVFDRQAKLGEFLEFWKQSEGDSDVPRQLSWYAENGPSEPGESQADYDAEAADFRRLAQEGCLAAEVGLIFS